MFGPSSLFKPESAIDKYQQYRQFGKELHRATVKFPFYRSYFHTACTHLGFRNLRGDIETPENDAAVAIVFDYAEQEVLEDGQTYLELFRSLNGPLPPKWNEILDAKLRAETGLYRVLETHPENCHVILEDLNQPGNQITLTDVMMSRTFAKISTNDNLCFLRLIEYPDFTMTAGFSCTFRISQERALLKLWDKYQGSVRFAQIARFYKEKGVPTRLM